jgi:prevent-host-death family protein
MTIVVGAREARQRFADLLGRVGYGKEVAIVERSGKPMMALIPIELYDQLVAEREARFHVIDRIRARLPEISDKEIEQDVSRAIAEVRGKRAADRR